jgi:predicted sugar kinase
VSSPKETCWGPTIYFIKQNKIESKNKDAPIKRIAYEAIKI